jgi:hypothetical protein
MPDYPVPLVHQRPRAIAAPIRVRDRAQQLR